MLVFSRQRGTSVLISADDAICIITVVNLMQPRCAEVCIQQIHRHSTEDTKLFTLTVAIGVPINIAQSVRLTLVDLRGDKV